jgi:hypothetical protein
MQRFGLKILKNVEVKDQYQVKNIEEVGRSRKHIIPRTSKGLRNTLEKL